MDLMGPIPILREARHLRDRVSFAHDLAPAMRHVVYNSRDQAEAAGGVRRVRVRVERGIASRRYAR